MRTYLARRLLLFVPVLLLVYTFVFVLIRIVPGDIVNLMMEGAGGRGTSAETAATLRRELGIDKSIPQQYAIQVQHLLRGDLGRSFRNGRPVTAEIGRRLPITLELAALAIAIALVAALLVGSLAALHHDSGVDRTISVLSIVALSVPAFWTGTLIVVLPARIWGYSPPFSFKPCPGPGAEPPADATRGGDARRHFRGGADPLCALIPARGPAAGLHPHRLG